MPNRRPLRSPEQAPMAAATLLGTWRDDALHLWGWDGRNTMAPAWLDRAVLDRRHAALGRRFASLDVRLPDGREIRPPTVRLPGPSAAAWLRSATRSQPSSDPLRWLGAVATLASATVASGHLTPVVRVERGMTVARWVPLTDAAVDDAIAGLAEAMPAVVLGDDDPTTVADIHAAFVDGLARQRLVDRWWMPDLPSRRQPRIIAMRSIFRALSSPDPLVDRRVDAEALAVIRSQLDRRRRRASGEPVVVPRLRLIVPDDANTEKGGDDWEVRLELVDELDPGRWCSADDVWDRTPLGREVAGRDDHLPVLAAALLEVAATVAAHVDDLADLAAVHEPAAVSLDLDAADRFLEQAPAALEQLGIELVGPERLVRGGVTVRGRVTPAPSSDRPGGFAREAVVEWRLVIADADGEAALSAAELARAEAAGATLLRVGRRWVRLDPAALRKARERLDAHSRDHQQVGAVELLRLAAEGELEAAADGSRSWTDELLGGLPDDRLHEVSEGPCFVGELRPYQRRGLGWLQFLERLGLGGCLADDMGLGKTATALAHLQQRSGPHLVVCPLSVVHNWVAEAARFTPEQTVVVHHGPERSTANANANVGDGDGDGDGDGGIDLAAADIVVTTYGLLPRDLPHLRSVAWSTVVLDEAQAIKNPATRAAKAVRALRAGQKLALTGTPVENRLSELWAIVDAVNPGLLGSREHFRHRYAKPIERDGDSDAAARLRRITQPFVLRRSKADRQLVPELPDKIEQIAWAGLTREQAVLYQHVVDQLLTDAASTTGMRRRGLVLAALTRLKQICNHPAHVLGDGSRLDGRSGKLARYDELVDELLDVGERALVFTQFREMGELLRRHAAERLELRVPFLHGGVARGRRESMVGEFQAGGGPPLLLVSLKAGGVGLNLTAASQVIHYDRWWNPAVEDQATDRAWRIGQGKTVLVHKLVCEGTVEERIATMIDDKRKLADAVVGSGEAWLSELSTADLRELVTLDRHVIGTVSAR
ncbi:MAG: DEAD/DEAH box helicase [Ilumatobacteraceae bacterium]